jgi:hypothetical protein
MTELARVAEAPQPGRCRSPNSTPHGFVAAEKAATTRRANL